MSCDIVDPYTDGQLNLKIGKLYKLAARKGDYIFSCQHTQNPIRILNGEFLLLLNLEKIIDFTGEECPRFTFLWNNHQIEYISNETLFTYSCRFIEIV